MRLSDLITDNKKNCGLINCAKSVAIFKGLTSLIHKFNQSVI